MGSAEHTLRHAEKANFCALPYGAASQRLWDQSSFCFIIQFCLSDSLFDSFMTNRKYALPNEGPAEIDNNR